MWRGGAPGSCVDASRSLLLLELLLQTVTVYDGGYPQDGPSQRHLALVGTLAAAFLLYDLSSATYRHRCSIPALEILQGAGVGHHHQFCPTVASRLVQSGAKL